MDCRLDVRWNVTGLSRRRRRRRHLSCCLPCLVAMQTRNQLTNLRIDGKLDNDFVIVSCYWPPLSLLLLLLILILHVIVATTTSSQEED